jgi:transposase
VQPKLGARVRLLAAGKTNKNDPGDARSAAIAALRSAARREARPDDHTAVLQVWSKRHRDLGRSRTQVVCRLHAVLCELIPGGISKAITAAHATSVLDATGPADAVAAARHQLAGEFPEDLRRTGAQLRQAKNRLTAAVRASGTTLTRACGVGPVIAATVLGAVTDVSRIASRDQFAACNGTAPIEVSSGSRKIAEGKTPKEALRALKRRISDVIFARLQADARRAAAALAEGPGGQPGNDSVSSAAGSHPEHRLFGQATPEPATTLRPRRRSHPATTPAHPARNATDAP